MDNKNSLLVEVSETIPLIKNLLSKFGFKYQKNQVTTNKVIHQDDILNYLKIESKNNFIGEKITDLNDVKELKNEIIDLYSEFIDSLKEYYSEVQNEIDENLNKSLMVIIKLLQSRGKKLESSLKRFSIKEEWTISKTKEEIVFILCKVIGEILSSVLQPLLNGVKTSNVYIKLIENLNDFLEKIGIHTYHLIDLKRKPLEKEEELFKPVPGENSETTDDEKKNMIKVIIQYPYLIKLENREYIVLDGEAIYWKKI